LAPWLHSVPTTSTTLAAHIATLTTFVDTWRTVGMNI
jgi:hypothetical protein